MTSRTLDLVSQILDSIQIDNDEIVLSLFNSFDINKLEKIYIMFEILMLHGIRYQANRCLKLITDEFIGYNDEVSEINFISLYASRGLRYTGNVFVYMNNLYAEKWNPLFVGIGVSKMSDEGAMFIAMKMLLKYMQGTDVSVWKVLRQTCIDIGASTSLDPLAIRIAELGGLHSDEREDEKSVKDHTYNYYSKTKTPDDRLFDIPEYYGDYNKRTLPEHVVETKYMQMANDALRKTRFMKRIEDRNLDRIVTTVLGPSNHFVNDDSNSITDIDARYGGSRMLVYVYNEFLIDEDNDDPWKGHCYQCLTKIDSIWDAVRMPLPLGGWREWFCSWSCAEKRSKETQTNTDIIESLIDSIKKGTPKVQVRSVVEDIEDI